MSSSSVYQACSNAHGGDSSLVMECVVHWMENDLQATIQQSVKHDELTDWLLILCGALVFFMQAGFAMVCAGMSFLSSPSILPLTLTNINNHHHHYYRRGS